MCQYLTLLGAGSDHRQIACCEHGTIHLTWGLVTIYLDEATFGRLVQTLTEGTGLVAPGQLSLEPCHLFYREPGYYQLWVRNTALNLAVPDFLMLIELVQMAWRKFCRRQGLPPDHHKVDLLRQFYRASRMSARPLFSLN